jgi:hypothetical protein
MKTLVLLFTTIISLQANAVFFGNETDPAVKAVTGYSEPQIHGIELLRAESGIVVKAEFLLKGCLNDITPVAQSIVQTEKELIVVLSALEVEVQASQDIKCIQANIKQAPVFVPVEGSLLQEYGDSIRIQFAKTNQVFQIMDSPF